MKKKLIKEAKFNYVPEENFSFQRFENLLNKLNNVGLKDVTTDIQEKNGTFAFQSEGHKRKMYYTVTNPSISRKKSMESLKHLNLPDDNRIVVRRSYPSHAAMGWGPRKNPIAVKTFDNYEEALAWILNDFNEKFPPAKPKNVNWENMGIIRSMYENINNKYNQPLINENKSKQIKLKNILKEIDLSQMAPNSYAGWFHKNSELVNKEFEKPNYSPDSMSQFLNSQFDANKINISPQKRQEIAINLKKYGNDKLKAMQYLYNSYLEGSDLGVNGPNKLGKKKSLGESKIQRILNKAKRTLND